MGLGILTSTQVGHTQLLKDLSLRFSPSNLAGLGEGVGQQAPSMAEPRAALAERTVEQFWCLGKGNTRGLVDLLPKYFIDP